MADSQSVDFELLKKYAVRRGSWYTLYPYQAQWHEEPDTAPANAEAAIDEYLETSNGSPLAVYTHFPFCERQCFFCQCATVISRDKAMHRRVLEDMRREIEWYADKFAKTGIQPNIRELHFGGGSPSILNESDFEYFVESLKLVVDFDKLDECSIEIDPRFNVAPDKLDFYADMGIDRISFGVQDFDEKVMCAINRVNPPEMIAGFLDHPARKRFQSVNFDILYRLPFQTVDGHRDTIERLIEFKPERVNICQLGHRPDVFPHQRAYRSEDMATIEETIEMKEVSTALMVEAGYERIGFDHFALPEDSFSKAKAAGTLHRNAMGYSTGNCIDILGIGPSAISTLGNWYVQNYYMLPQYRDMLAEQDLPAIRYLRCTNDDMTRRQIIYDFFMYGSIDKRQIESRFGISDFDQYFAADIGRLSELFEDGLAEDLPDVLRLTDSGFINPRHASEAFDTFLHGKGVPYAHSREVGDGRKSFDRKTQIAG